MTKRKTFDLREGPADRRQDPLDNSPLWAQIGLKYGLPTLAAGFLLWFITLGPGNNRVSADGLTRIEQALQKHIDVMAEESKQRVQSDMRRLEHEMRMENYGRRTCENTGKTEAARIGCQSVR